MLAEASLMGRKKATGTKPSGAFPFLRKEKETAKGKRKHI
jgi:hypothetical protein